MLLAQQKLEAPKRISLARHMSTISGFAVRHSAFLGRLEMQESNWFS
jgi:hypothetical protein